MMTTTTAAACCLNNAGVRLLQQSQWIKAAKILKDALAVVQAAAIDEIPSSQIESYLTEACELTDEKNRSLEHNSLQVCTLGKSCATAGNTTVFVIDPNDSEILQTRTIVAVIIYNLAIAKKMEPKTSIRYLKLADSALQGTEECLERCLLYEMVLRYGQLGKKEAAAGFVLRLSRLESASSSAHVKAVAKAA